MKTKWIKYILPLYLLLLHAQCTDLSETTYDTITTETFYQTPENVMQAFLRPFGYAYYSYSRAYFYTGESSADHFITPKRDGHFYDGGIFYRMHYHTWTIDDAVADWPWFDLYGTIVYCNNVLDDFDNKLGGVNISEQTVENYKAQLRGLRASLYLRLLDLYRNVPIVTEAYTNDLPFQAPPKQTFEFIEKECIDIIPLLNAKASNGGNGTQQGEWTKACAAATLVRLYLNAELWIGEDRLTDCETYCNKILNGEYGYYDVDQRWDAPFDWNNEESHEIIYAYTSSYGGTHWLYSATGLLEIGPFNASYYFGAEWATYPRFALSPGLDLNGNEYAYANGKPVRKFKNYPDDVRLKNYKNLGNSTREGMFLGDGYQLYGDPANPDTLKSWAGEYNIYIRDQVGIFRDTDPSSVSPNPSGDYDTRTSSLDHACESSSWYPVKYPIYSKEDAGAYEADFVVYRLPEIIYSLAEVKFRKGDKPAVAQLLNSVRKRYYPAGSSSLYSTSGNEITEQELLDEWGREFLGEGLRRMTLCRFGVFNTAWWDKEADPDNHTMIFPLSRNALNSNPNLKQNPGYEDPR